MLEPGQQGAGAIVVKVYQHTYLPVRYCGSVESDEGETEVLDPML